MFPDLFHSFCETAMSQMWQLFCFHWKNQSGWRHCTGYCNWWRG